MLSFLISNKYHALRWYRINRARFPKFSWCSLITWTTFAIIEGSILYAVFLFIHHFA